MKKNRINKKKEAKREFDFAKESSIFPQGLLDPISNGYDQIDPQHLGMPCPKCKGQNTEIRGEGRGPPAYAIGVKEREVYDI